MSPSNIIISTRGNKIGDVIFALPVATLLKMHFPQSCIALLGTSYTKAIIDACQSVDLFIDEEHFLKDNFTIDGKAPQCILHLIPSYRMAWQAKRLNIPLRIGTSRRWYHWLTCNQRVNLSRKNSNLHEIQLNLMTLSAFNIAHIIALNDISSLYALSDLGGLFKHDSLLDDQKCKVIIHPKSGGSAKEWHLENYISLIQSLDTTKFQIFISGSHQERETMQELFDAVGDCVEDICGKLTLTEFIGLIARCDALVACSTGPLHLAAALGKAALGLYAPREPIFARRWGPVGKNAHIFESGNPLCVACRRDGIACACLNSVPIKDLVDVLKALYPK